MFMVMAEQSTSQQKDQQMVSVILANVGTVISFRSGNPDDERLLLPLFSPSVEQGELTNLPAFNFYAKLSAIKPQEPLSGQTILLPDQGDEMIAQKAVELSRASFARKQDEPTVPDTSKEGKENIPVDQPASGRPINTEPLIDEM
jgi:hypothetical protein